MQWVLIKITSDKFTSACLLGWKEGFSPKSTMMNWHLSATGNCFPSTSLHFASELPTSPFCFSFLLPTLCPSLREEKGGHWPPPPPLAAPLTRSDLVIPTAPLQAFPAPAAGSKVCPHDGTCKITFLPFLFMAETSYINTFLILIPVFDTCGRGKNNQIKPCRET